MTGGLKRPNQLLFLLTTQTHPWICSSFFFLSFKLVNLKCGHSSRLRGIHKDPLAVNIIYYICCCICFPLVAGKGKTGSFYKKKFMNVSVNYKKFWKIYNFCK